MDERSRHNVKILMSKHEILVNQKIDEENEKLIKKVDQVQYFDLKKHRYEPVYAHIGPNNLIQIGCLIMTQENFKLLYNNIKQTKNELLRKSRDS